MTSKVRIEYVRPRRGGDAFGFSAQAVQQICDDAELLTITGVSSQSAIAPVFPDDGTGFTGNVWARVSCEMGAVVITPPSVEIPAPTATQVNGIRLSADDQPLLFRVEAGWRFAFIESDVPMSLTPVGGAGDVIDVVLTVDGAAYADGDVFFDTQEIANAVREPGGRATLLNYTLLDKDDVGQTIDLVFLNANVSLGAENSPPNITDANAEAIIATGGPDSQLRISAANYADFGASKVATKTGLAVQLEAAPATRSLWIAGVIRGAGTFSNSPRLKLALIWD